MVESLDLLVSSNGTVLHSEILGAVKMRSYLSGMPELKLGLNDKAMFQSSGRKAQGKVQTWQCFFFCVFSLCVCLCLWCVVCVCVCVWVGGWEKLATFLNARTHARAHLAESEGAGCTGDNRTDRWACGLEWGGEEEGAGVGAARSTPWQRVRAHVCLLRVWWIG